MRRPLLDVSSNVSNSPEVAWEAVARLIGNRQRGQVIERDPRAHEALRLLGGKAAYDAVASTPERIRPRFIRLYALLSEIAELMRDLEEAIGGKQPVRAQGEADSSG
jgi:hypothetical protein